MKVLILNEIHKLRAGSPIFSNEWDLIIIASHIRITQKMEDSLTARLNPRNENAKIIKAGKIHIIGGENNDRQKSH